jgi:hypothetical protein
MKIIFGYPGINNSPHKKSTLVIPFPKKLYGHFLHY